MFCVVFFRVVALECDKDQSHPISGNSRGNLIRYSRSSFGSWNLQLSWHTRKTRGEHENTVHETVLKCIRRINIRTWAAIWVGIYIKNTVFSVVGYLPHHTAAQQQLPVLNNFTILLGETERIFHQPAGRERQKSAQRQRQRCSAQHASLFFASDWFL